ncbi:histidine phosphatase family protein [Patescibacteria group bacterium AH-259-L07]|nr:histidine phosphatase family protein [Patescibacteria group bacterium AH-259-L07]
MLDIYLIRHAESEMNNNRHLIGGRLNETPLSARGIYHANLLGKRLKDSGVAFNEVYSSTAARTIETAKIVGTQLGYSLDDVVKTTELLELDQGEWEGKPRVDIYTPEVLALINKDNWNFTPPNGESQRAVEERMLRFVNENLLSKYSEGTVAGVFTHGVAIKCLLRGIMDFSPALTYKVNLDDTSITRLKYTDRGWHLVTVNDTAHLLGEDKIEDPYSSAPKSK